MMGADAWMMPAMVWGMGLLWLFLVVVLVLAAAALLKYLRSDQRNRRND